VKVGGQQAETVVETIDEVLSRPDNSLPGRMLSFAENRLYGGLKFEKRAREWLAGRLAAKEIIRRHLERTGRRAPDRRLIQVLPDERGAPRVQVDFGEGMGPIPVSLSISHGSQRVAAALVDSPAIVGIDVERMARRDADLVRTYLTAAERTWMTGDSRLETLAWSVKEAVFKALPGVGPDPLAIEICRVPPAGFQWTPVELECRPFQGRLEAWYGALPDYVVTLAIATGDRRSGGLPQIT